MNGKALTHGVCSQEELRELIDAARTFLVLKA